MPRKKNNKGGAVKPCAPHENVVPWAGKARVRIRLPEDPTKFYNALNDGLQPWVTVGYTTWTIEEWIALYSDGYTKGDTRNWDFFGEIIEIWPTQQEKFNG